MYKVNMHIIHFVTSKTFNTNYVEVRNQNPQYLVLLKLVGHVCSESQARNETLEKDNIIMKTNIYVQQTWASPKYFSQAKNEIVRDPKASL